MSGSSCKTVGGNDLVVEKMNKRRHSIPRAQAAPKLAQDEEKWFCVPGEKHFEFLKGDDSTDVSQQFIQVKVRNKITKERHDGTRTFRLCTKNHVRFGRCRYFARHSNWNPTHNHIYPDMIQKRITSRTLNDDSTTFSSFEKDLYHFMTKYKISYTAIGSPEFKALYRTIWETGKGGNLVEMDNDLKVLDRHRLSQRIDERGKQLSKAGLLRRAHQQGSVVIDAGTVGGIHFVVGSLITPHISILPHLIHYSISHQDHDSIFYQKFADDCIHKMTRAKIKISAFIADNAESLQSGLKMDRTMALCGFEEPSHLQNDDHRPAVPLTFRCANHLLNLAWGDSKDAIPYLSHLLDTMHKCTVSFPSTIASEIGSKPHLVSPTRWIDEIHPIRWYCNHYQSFPSLSEAERIFFKEIVHLERVLTPLDTFRAQLSKRTTKLGDLFKLTCTTVQTIRNEELNLPTKWRAICETMIDCLFTRLFCNDSSSILFLAAVMTKEGYQSFIRNEPIPFVQPFPKEVQPETIDSDESVVDAVLISSDDDEDIEIESAERRMQRAERAKRRKEMKEIEMDRLEKEWKKRASTGEKKRLDRMNDLREQTEHPQQSCIPISQEAESLEGGHNDEISPPQSNGDAQLEPMIMPEFDHSPTPSTFSIEDMDRNDASDDLGTIVQSQHKHFPFLPPLLPLPIPSTTITTLNSRNPKTVFQSTMESFVFRASRPTRFTPLATRIPQSIPQTTPIVSTDLQFPPSPIHIQGLEEFFPDISFELPAITIDRALKELELGSLFRSFSPSPTSPRCLTHLRTTISTTCGTTKNRFVQLSITMHRH
ncbi:hypothetical protein BLNAU_22583 [Blattamonas nauphoetae]|uniref:Transposase n=1 Tax=Blattamonas nauphoetae TaxID=2049346 RepID=A0ABQ9WSN4_9EUKA|nr:hypothetical protein BLNAU_22583 [Blattamonas nauphoetae]